MKIAHFISNFSKGGKYMAAYNLWIKLAQRGHHIQVFTFSEDRKDHFDSYEGIDMFAYGSILRYRSEQISHKILFAPLRENSDIVHIHSGISMALFAGFLYSMIKKKPLVITWHGDSIKETKYNRYTGIVPSLASYFYNKYLIHKILSHTDIIISVSGSYINESKILDRYRDKIVIIPNGVNFDEFNVFYSRNECKNMLKIDTKYMILFIGSLYPLKGPQILIRAMPKIIKEFENIIFILAGEGNIVEYKKLAKELGVEKFIRFPGYVYSEKPMYYKACDIFILPSLLECFGIVNLEAMLCGVPIVASKVGGVPDIVEDGENGILVPPGDCESLSNAIICLLKDEETRERFGKNSKEKIQNYSWEKIAESTEGIYRELCGVEK